MLKKILIFCFMLGSFSMAISPQVDAYSIKKTHTVSMAQLKKSTIFTKKVDSAAPVTANGQAIYAKIASVAPTFIGAPYLFGGVTPLGFDCSGFIHYVHQLSGLNIGRMSSEDYYKISQKVSVPESGDLVYFKDTYKTGISHMGIYLGDQQFIHASSRGVEISKLDNVYWKQHFVGFYRFNQVTVK